jgi:hypothetical protein
VFLITEGSAACQEAWLAQLWSHTGLGISWPMVHTCVTLAILLLLLYHLLFLLHHLLLLLYLLFSSTR